MRKLPVVCLILSVFRLLSGRLVLSKKYLDTCIKSEQGKEFRIFRHIRFQTDNRVTTGCVFLVSFKFTRLSHSANKLTSIIPMLVIAGSPGFVAKMYAVCPDDGYWRGMYQWESVEFLNDYKKSFVFRMMNKRALPDSINMLELNNQSLTEYIINHET